jgi:sec-independent protein translocase protein TatA
VVVEAELGPGGDLRELLEGAESTGEGDKGIGEIEHEALAVVHRSDFVEFGEAGVGDLAGEQPARNDPDDLAALGEYFVGEHTHEPDGAPAVDEAEPFGREAGTEAAGGVGIGRIESGGRPAVDADCVKGHRRKLVGMHCGRPGSMCAVCGRTQGGTVAPMDIGPAELIIVLVIVLLLFGGKKLPELARSLGQARRELQKGEQEGATDPETEEK